MAVERGPEVSEAQIAVHWKEEEYVRPNPKFIGQANLADPAVAERFSEKKFPECFREYADLLPRADDDGCGGPGRWSA